MPAKRNYGEACGVARALDVVGERWALMVVRELLLGPKRFGDLRADLPGVSSDVLAQRLRGLEEAGLLERRRLAPPANVGVYALTPKGAALEPVLVALGRWGGANAPPPAPGTTMSLDATVVSLRALFDPARAAGLDATVQLRLGEHRFRARVADGTFEVVRGDADAPDAVVETDAPTLMALVRGRLGLPDAVTAGDARVEGDEAVVERFLGLFPLPEPAAAAGR